VNFLMITNNLVKIYSFREIVFVEYLIFFKQSNIIYLVRERSRFCRAEIARKKSGRLLMI